MPHYNSSSGLYSISQQRTIKETFALNEVPKEALVVGMAGVLPYLATSLSTAYLAWDINHASLTGSGFLVSGPTAEILLHIIEPLQIGYGAVVSADVVAQASIPTDNIRSSRSLEPSTGDLNGPNMEALMATRATPLESSHLRLHGQLS